jgi:hypothetical protein
MRVDLNRDITLIASVVSDHRRMKRKVFRTLSLAETSSS